jgi:uncharacterized membrane protein YfcA
MPSGAIGFIYLPALVAIAAASVLTAPIGARLAHRLDMSAAARGFAVLLYGLAGYMLYKGNRRMTIVSIEPARRRRPGAEGGR